MESQIIWITAKDYDGDVLEDLDGQIAALRQKDRQAQNRYKHTYG